MTENAAAIFGIICALFTAGGTFAVSMYRISKLEEADRLVRMEVDNLNQKCINIDRSLDDIRSTLNANSDDLRWIRNRLEE